jgi:hypothetical protein
MTTSALGGFVDRNFVRPTTKIGSLRAQPRSPRVAH